MSRLQASDLHDVLLAKQVTSAHLAELDVWIQSEASGKGVDAADIASPLPDRTKLAATYKLATIVARGMSAQNQAAVGSNGDDAYAVKRRMYLQDLGELLPQLTAVDWTGVPDTSASPTISIPLERG